jgi:hypothetical protein
VNQPAFVGPAGQPLPHRALRPDTTTVSDRSTAKITPLDDDPTINPNYVRFWIDVQRHKQLDKPFR